VDGKRGKRRKIKPRFTGQKKGPGLISCIAKAFRGRYHGIRSTFLAPVSLSIISTFKTISEVQITMNKFQNHQHKNSL
jgi:hypothetical protein